MTGAHIFVYCKECSRVLAYSKNKVVKENIMLAKEFKGTPHLHSPKKEGVSLICKCGKSNPAFREADTDLVRYLLINHEFKEIRKLLKNEKNGE